MGFKGKLSKKNFQMGLHIFLVILIEMYHMYHKYTLKYQKFTEKM
jgi:hypothetical protein